KARRVRIMVTFPLILVHNVPDKDNAARSYVRRAVFLVRTSCPPTSLIAIRARTRTRTCLLFSGFCGGALVEPRDNRLHSPGGLAHGRPRFVRGIHSPHSGW